MEVADEFYKRWNFPNCIGAMDGKHVLIKCSINSGSYYFNYKSTFTIVLLALVDADYKFLYVDVGCTGRVSDGGVFRNSSLGDALEHNKLNVPDSEEEQLPYVVVGDDAFPLKTYIMKPYALRNFTVEKRILNYHLSRARRIVENVFGIFANRFRIFLLQSVAPENTIKIVLASCVLHNYLRTESPDRYTPPGFCDVESTETGQFEPLVQQGGNRYSSSAMEVRGKYCKYFNTVDRVPWIDKVI